MAVIQRVGSPAKPRKWMSVHEMGDMLGLKKTDRYWLVHKNYFRTETLLGKMRVEIASFEKWYANQDWYHKVNGEAPGKELRLRSYSPKEIQEMLGTDNATVYEILKKNNIETVTMNERLRVPTDAFWDWYHSQSRYRTQEDRKKDAAAEAASLSMPEMARLLDVPRSTVYVAIHRAHQEHVPNCMRPLINKKLKLISELTEHTLANEIEAPHEILRK